MLRFLGEREDKIFQLKLTTSLTAIETVQIANKRPYYIKAKNLPFKAQSFAEKDKKKVYK